MNSKIVYIDSGVLINAFRGVSNVSIKATQVLNDFTCIFASSLFVKLETLPKAHYNKQLLEVEFYNVFFDAVDIWATDLERITEIADRISKQYGLAAMDALQIAAAISVNAMEFITTEKTSKPMHRVTEISIISIA